MSNYTSSATSSSQLISCDINSPGPHKVGITVLRKVGTSGFLQRMRRKWNEKQPIIISWLNFGRKCNHQLSLSIGILGVTSPPLLPQRNYLLLSPHTACIQHGRNEQPLSSRPFCRLVCIQCWVRFNLWSCDRWILWLSVVMSLTLSFVSLFTTRYNVYNAYVKVFGFPLAIAALQLGVGLLYAVPLWVLGVRKMPKITFKDFTLLLPIGKSH